MQRWSLWLVMWWAGSVVADTDIMQVTYFQTDSRYEYRVALLKQVLEVTKEAFGPYQLNPVSQSITQSRGVSMLEEGRLVTVAFLPTSIERERRLRPIRKSIMQGILGFRILLSNDAVVDALADVESLQTLSNNFMAGFGSQWADLEILEANGLKVVGATQYEALFAMLNARRFDYFPRGLNEAWNEMDRFSSKYSGLRVVPNIALYYPYPVYFFVSPNNLVLAKRIEKGMDQLESSGMFQHLFMSYHQDLITQAGLHKRRILHLSNPILPEDTPDIRHAWLP